jgi:UDP-N-acetylmuramoylalanine--D-glutamate ligase
VTSLVGKIAPTATVVCECSSFQLEDTIAFAPEIAVLLNIAPDHLDRHRSLDDYVAAKLRVFANQKPDDVAIAPDDAPALPGSARRVVLGAGPETALVDASPIGLPGEHNRQNAIAAAAICLERGIEPEAVVAGLQSFGGVAHRLELVAVRDGVSYVNDSKATNVDSTLVALRAYDGGIHLIAGGRGKQQDFAPLAPLVAERCAAVYLIGEAAAELRAALAGTGVPLLESGELDRAVAAARAAASPGETVLLSPACASYDQYPDFEARGEEFRRLV